MSVKSLVLISALFVGSGIAGFMFYETIQGKQAESLFTSLNQGEATGGAAMIASQKPMGKMRPVFSLNDIDGKSRNITEWDGKALVVNFWATWCAPCLREIPVLIAMQEKMADKNIQFIGIAIDDAEAVSKFAQKTSFNYPVLVGEQEGIDAAEAFGADVVALPMTVFTDHSGRVIDLHAGEITRAQIKAILKDLNP